MSKPLPLPKGQRKISEVLDAPGSSKSVPEVEETSVRSVEEREF